MSQFAAAFIFVLLINPASVTAEEKEGNRLRTFASSELIQSPDFLFGQPSHSLGIRFQWVRPQAESDIFSFVTEELTLSKSDFDLVGLSADMSFPLTSRLDTLAGFEFARTSSFSEHRNLVEIVGGETIPIRQENTLTILNLLGSLEFAITPRGREIGQYSWITSRVTPYVGIGGGLMWYRFAQEGDFVDNLDNSLPIFTALLSSDGWTLSYQSFAGIDVSVARKLQLTGEIRYLWASAPLSKDYVGFEPIDLSGFRVSAGFQIFL